MFVDERAINVQLPWALWSHRTRAGAHVTCRLADGNFEPILDYSQIIALRMEALGVVGFSLVDGSWEFRRLIPFCPRY